jgi:probable rRNA maturation factor
VIRVHITNLQSDVPIDRRRLRRAVRMVLQDAGITEATMSVAVVDDPTIRDLHRRHLGLDEPTDVLSFPLEEGEGGLEGEVVVGAGTAKRQARRYGWSPADELLLYVIHGVLHLVGHDDHTRCQRAAMRAGEARYLARFGLEVPRRIQRQPRAE